MIPRIDPKVRHVGVSKLREITRETLYDLKEKNSLIVLQSGAEPLAVIVPYETFLLIQNGPNDAETVTRNPKV